MATTFNKYNKSQAITNTVVGTTPAQKFIPTVGSISTDSTETHAEGTTMIGTAPTNTSLITITDNLIAKYDQADES